MPDEQPTILQRCETALDRFMRYRSRYRSVGLLLRLARILVRGVLLTYDAVNEFNRDDAFRHGAALAYYTVFSLSPMLIIVVSVAGFFFDEEQVKSQFSDVINQINPETADLIFSAMESLRKNNTSLTATVIGIATVLFGSTAVFYTMQRSLNIFWKVRARIRKGVLRMAIDRLLSFAMVILLGLVLLVSFLLEASLTLFVNNVEGVIVNLADWVSEVAPAKQEELHRWTQEDLPFLIAQANFAFWVGFFASIMINTFMFTLIFKLLPDAKIRWRDVVVGALFTALLFKLGSIGINWYIGQSHFGTTFGAAGALVVLLAWVFYSSQILFFGAEFTYVYTQQFGQQIQPSGFAVKIIDCQEDRIEEAPPPDKKSDGTQRPNAKPD